MRTISFLFHENSKLAQRFYFLNGITEIIFVHLWQNWNSGYDEIFEYRPISSKASFFNLTFEASIPSTYKEDEVLLHAL